MSSGRLRELSVSNFAVIEETRLILGTGLNVITGDTGAGKSLLVDALMGALGSRMDRDMIRDGSNGLYVEAVFQIDPEDDLWQVVSDEFGIPRDEEGSLVLSRELTLDTRSISRINGRTVPLSTIRSIGKLLVDIHAQGNQHSLADAGSHLAVLDEFAKLDDVRTSVMEEIIRLRQSKKALDELNSTDLAAESGHELLKFQLEEIEVAQLHVGEDEELFNERDILTYAIEIQSACSTAYEYLTGGQSNASDSASQAIESIKRISKTAEPISKVLEELEAATANIEDLARQIRTYGNSIEDDPLRLKLVEERIELISNLKRKYGGSITEIISFAERAKAELGGISTNAQRREQITQEVEKLESQVGEHAWELSSRRQKAAPELTASVALELTDLAMQHMIFQARLSRRQDANGITTPNGERYAIWADGIDELEFLISTNRGEQPKALAKIASGGETARLMLAIKGVLQTRNGVGALVFDEIDSGVGGRAADIVGQKLWGLSKRCQVLCVTHLPQIAAHADHHFHVDKLVSDGRTRTRVTTLEGQNRVLELSLMLGGRETEASKSTARQMITGAERIKNIKQDEPHPHR